jgi:hypothetical protein
LIEGALRWASVSQEKLLSNQLSSSWVFEALDDCECPSRPPQQGDRTSEGDSQC